jgi:thiol-activated cytolysin
VKDVQPKEEQECLDCPVEQQEEDLLCNYRKFTETAQYSEFIAFQPNSASLWPGSVIQGNDAQNGFFTPVGVARAPMTFSISLENIAASPIGHMESPTLSSFREERNRILAAGITGSTPAAIDFQVTEIHSSSQISLALGASVLWPGGGSVSGGFNFSSTEKKTKVLVNYTQAYYTIDVDTPVEAKDFFAPGIDREELSVFMGDENPPAYVQSITYGRRVIFSVESEETADTIKAALEAAYEEGVKENANQANQEGAGEEGEDGTTKVEISIKPEYEKVLKESTIRAFVLGGSGAEAAGAIAGFKGLMEYVTKGGDYSKDSPGAPIAYKIAYLDNAVTKLAFTTDFTERVCLRNRAQMRVSLENMAHVGGGDNGSNIELYGYVSVRYPTAESDVVDCRTGGEVVNIWNLNEGQWLEMEEFTTWTPSSGVYVDLENVPVDAEKKICVMTQLWEEDYSTWEFSADDNFGYAERMMSFTAGWHGLHTLQPRGDSQNGVDVGVRIEIK